MATEKMHAAYARADPRGCEVPRGGPLARRSRGAPSPARYTRVSTNTRMHVQCARAHTHTRTHTRRSVSSLYARPVATPPPRCSWWFAAFAGPGPARVASHLRSPRPDFSPPLGSRVVVQHGTRKQSLGQAQPARCRARHIRRCALLRS